jgi:hypothetical protein
MQIFTLPDATIVQPGRPFTSGGVTFPANWISFATADDFAAHGIVVTTVPDPVPSPPVIASVTPRQARLALNAAALLSQVDAAVAAADQATQITWEFATQIDRNDPLIATLAAGLNLSSAQVDALFAQAATL